MELYQLITKPSSEQEKSRLEESKGCNSCLDWHHHCNAECCRFFSLDYAGENLERDPVVFKRNLTPDMIWYYKLHGCRYARGQLMIPKKFVHLHGNIILVKNDCEFLDGNLCKGHATMTKPRICRDFTEKQAFELKGVQVTHNCLYKYKRGVTE